jgi:hypothetical protein
MKRRDFIRTSIAATMLRNTFVSAVLAAVLTASISLPSYAQTTCPVEGSAKPGKGPLSTTKRELNKLKNRTASPSDFQSVKVGAFLDLEEEQDAELEKRGVVLDGYFLDVKKEGAESPNCYSKSHVDFHMWIGAKRPKSLEQATTFRSHAVVVEATPGTQRDHLTWTYDNLKELRLERVRVYGWYMFDPEHPPQLGKTRGTLWEIHPVTKIEVFKGGRWIEY